MIEAGDAYGCGFYNQNTWMKPYARLRVAVDRPYRDDGE